MIDWETLQFPRHVHKPSIPPDWVWKRVETLEECQQALEEGWMLHASIATEAPVESEIAAWTDFIPIESVVHRDMSNLLPTLYDLADRGLIRFIPQKPSRLSLGSAVMFLDFLAEGNGSPSLEELMALPTGNRVNFGDGDLAGDGCVRYIIAMIASRFQDKQ